LPLSIVDKLKAEEQTSINVLLGKLNNPLCLKFSSWKLTITLVKSCDIDSFFQNKKNNRHAHSYEVICQLPESISELTIKFRQGGEKIYLHQGHSASLKKLYQIEKILPWMRDKLPLIYIKEELICAVAGFVAGRYQLNQQNNYKHLNPKIFIHFLFDPS
jgi:tRNA(Ile)-lysidine synthetase-like protein